MLKSFAGVTVGTKLLVRSDLTDNVRYDDYRANNDMARKRGTVVTVTHVGGTEDWVLIKNASWFWSPGMFECIVDDDVSLFDLISKGSETNA